MKGGDSHEQQVPPNHEGPVTNGPPLADSARGLLYYSFHNDEPYGSVWQGGMS